MTCNGTCRYYDLATAQFTTPDPLFAMTRSRYGYTGNDPVNGTDPLGLFGYGTIAAAFGGIVGGLGSVMNAIGNEFTQVVGGVFSDPSADLTLLSIVGCIAVGVAGCGVVTAAGWSYCAWQRYEEVGLAGSWKADLIDFGVTYLIFASGATADGSLAAINAHGGDVPRWQLYAARTGMSGFEAGSFIADRMSGGDAIGKSLNPSTP